MVESAFIFVMALGLGGGGLPLGLPPAAEVPLLAKVAPDECMFYLSWAGVAEADPASKNHTERLLAEKEVQRFIAAVEKAIGAAISQDAARPGVPAGPGGNQQRTAQAGAALARSILTKPGALFVGKVTLDLEQRRPTVDAGLVVAAGTEEETQALMKLIHALETSLGPMVTQVKDADGNQWSQLQTPPDAPQVRWGFRGRYLILGAGEGAIGKIVKRATTAVPGWLAALRKQLPVQRTSTVMYVNVGRITELAAAAGGPPEMAAALEALGLKNVKYYAHVGGLDERAYVSRQLVALEGTPTGLLSLVDAKPLTAADLAPIPRDATLAFAVRLDPEKVFREIQALVNKVDPRSGEDFNNGVNEGQTLMGFNFSDDLFKAVGDTWRVYNSPSDGGLIATGLTAVADVRDAKKLAATAEKIEAFVQAQAVRFSGANQNFGRPRRHATIDHFDFKGQKIYYVKFVGEESPVAPAWCVTDKEFVISLFPSHVKSYLSRGSKFESIADSPAVTKLFSGDKGPVCVSYADTRELMKSAYPVIQIAATFLFSEAQRENIDLDTSMLPSLGAILPHLIPATGTVTRTTTGIEIVSRQTLPVGGGAFLMAVPMAFLGSARAVEFDRVGDDIKKADPANPFNGNGAAAGDRPRRSGTVAPASRR